MTDPETQLEPKRFQCRHVFADGRRCRAVSLRHEELCYQHHSTRRHTRSLYPNCAQGAAFTLPNPEDRCAIQSGIGEVLQRIAANELDPRRAGLLLYGLQIASLNLSRIIEADHDETVEEVTHDPELGPLAPAAEFQIAQREKGPTELMLEELEREFGPGGTQATAAKPVTVAQTVDPDPDPALSHRDGFHEVPGTIDINAVAQGHKVPKQSAYARLRRRQAAHRIHAALSAYTFLRSYALTQPSNLSPLTLFKTCLQVMQREPERHKLIVYALHHKVSALSHEPRPLSQRSPHWRRTGDRVSRPLQRRQILADQ